MLWQHYVFRRGAHALDMWDNLFEGKTIRLLYITGRGFDTRAQSVLSAFVRSVRASGCTVERGELLQVSFTNYHLSDELRTETRQNADALEALFSPIGGTSTVAVGTSATGVQGDDDVSPTNALRSGTEAVLRRVTDQTDIVLDVSSLPRVVYLSLMTALLERLIPSKTPNALSAGGVNFQVLVAEDANLDSRIRSEDPSNDILLIPGFSSILQAESVQDWPLVWFPILGENRVGQLEKILDSNSIPDAAEICPVLPHPSRDPRRADRLLLEYKRPLFDKRDTPTSNIFYVHETHPFEVYRELLRAMERYSRSMGVIGGCRLVVTPLASKLITVGAGLACFEMRPRSAQENYGVAIPYVEATRYVVSPEDLRLSKPEIAALLLTGIAYQDARVNAGLS